ncbi:hypothetical protein ANCCAN_13601 [Ancylostoma caninum]|uniref:PPM-type phosphatase domain-containing protein n=1 Tax=Ancylostoma caninum TaxID=29170 RepID=A0A368G7X2_ANCCA|nr:hypothetical protein ANCCAN_13601 [Ancylostoma caninum]
MQLLFRKVQLGIAKDAHNCILDLNGEWSMFAVYDGHGGDEVSKYTAMKLPDFLKERLTFELWSMRYGVTPTFLNPMGID